MLSNIAWPGALVLVALITGSVLAAIFAPPDLLRPLLGSEGLALLVAGLLSIRRKPASK